MKIYCQITYRVPFSETDAMGIVHHSNHAKYLERGRVEMLRMIGQNYLELTKRGVHVPLTEIQIRFKRPLVFDDVLLVQTSISKLSRMRLNFEYQIFKGAELHNGVLTPTPAQGTPLVTGETFHCWVNNEGRPIEASEEMFLALQKYAGEMA